MTTLIDLNGDRKTLSDIDKELSVLKEKMRVLKDEISQSDERQQKGNAMIEKAKDKMRAERDINIFTTALADKIIAFQKDHMSTCDKVIVVQREYNILQLDYSALQDEYIALAKYT
jgi:predicted  nucleic acid-binding Zn-ribbon protein